MDGRVRTGAGLVLVALACGGCGTIQNVRPTAPTGEGDVPPPTRVYGGVRRDWAEWRALDFTDVGGINFYLLPFYLADFPLSLVGDTLTLPYTAGVEATRAVRDFYFPSPPAKEPERPHGIAGRGTGFSNE